MRERELSQSFLTTKTDVAVPSTVPGRRGDGASSANAWAIGVGTKSRWPLGASQGVVR